MLREALCLEDAPHAAEESSHRGAFVPGEGEVVGVARVGETVPAGQPREAAVKAAEQRAALSSAESAQQTEDVRFLGGKTFARRGYAPGAGGEPVAFWVDTAYTEDMPLETVEFASDAYWALLDQPNAAEWLSLSSEMIVVLEDGTALRITSAAP